MIFGKKKDIGDKPVKVMKISREALMEFVSEMMLEKSSEYMGEIGGDMATDLDFDLETGDMIVCQYALSENPANDVDLLEEVDIERVMRNIEDTTDTIHGDDIKYRVYTIDELKKAAEE